MVLGTILGVFTRRSKKNNGAEALKAALREPRKDVELHGVFEEPRLDPQGANTAKFPVTVYDRETGEEYTTTAVEFAIEREEGKERMDDFLATHGIESREELDAIEGATAEVRRNERGNIEVDW